MNEWRGKKTYYAVNKNFMNGRLAYNYCEWDEVILYTYGISGDSGSIRYLNGDFLERNAMSP